METQSQKEMMNIVTPIDGVIQMHGLFIDVERKKISFDVVVDFDIDDQDTFLNQIKQRIEDRFNDYQVFVNLDVDYSD